MAASHACAMRPMSGCPPPHQTVPNDMSGQGRCAEFFWQMHVPDACAGCSHEWNEWMRAAVHIWVMGTTVLMQFGTAVYICSSARQRAAVAPVLHVRTRYKIAGTIYKAVHDNGTTNIHWVRNCLSALRNLSSRFSDKKCRDRSYMISALRVQVPLPYPTRNWSGAPRDE